MNKDQVTKIICDNGVVPVIRADSKEQAIRISEACLEGGINSLEITFTVPKAHKVLEYLADRYINEDIAIGAGTVMDSETARIAILSGASFIVSPYLNESTIKLCNRYQIASLPGVMSIKEVVQAMELGVDIMKLFPGEVQGTDMIKAIKGPIPQAKIMPTGGVSLENISDWINSGAVAVGIGGSLTSSSKVNDFQTITDLSRQFVQKVQEAKKELIKL
ncbi:bifunctional 2-keto-4-hydroxyglutarate aldolase/2-keto-3-deoxy-6-phosphogluconate aldolase [Bacillus sp. AFS055030]|uniref:bifunctional 2-keto-4-hydroxyglutarate aldolase/2-keto-3-deoxy-6-phosphogluconate aldolase n=1 Tax=Bacillus sp. AFS055030 TaxID=2033507 RepID=UPI000BFE9A78|nr:bifunctional 2-keto-4-hydroxyglutarate aldolase/2-keto-3-deoxy-6-phosphogluconate aldolase [Bacillus sp. AFS055030]PGL70992.1 bifunctional 2-keto-4-hydroxyglutarate aldolase/2-keto-3-deoxy-6-phosphogluconate aldolase [Bacillus sp. AFS055030]